MRGNQTDFFSDESVKYEEIIRRKRFRTDFFSDDLGASKLY